MATDLSWRDKGLISDVREALMVHGDDDQGGTGWRAGLLLNNPGAITGAAVEHYVEFGTCTGWTVCERAHHDACRAKARMGKRVPVFAMDGGHDRHGCEGFWTTEQKLRRWIERQEEGR